MYIIPYIQIIIHFYGISRCPAGTRHYQVITPELFLCHSLIIVDGSVSSSVSEAGFSDSLDVQI